ncbi:MAG: hypothetical protein KC431_05110, partial [Myxococcales bacterium]|nr:hypothetical protein [Myxococcales bacterium]
MSGEEQGREAPKLPVLRIEQLALGEIEGEEAEALRRDIALRGRDPQEVLDELAADDARILADYPPERMAAAILRRAEQAEPARRARVWPWVLAPTLAAAAVLL